MASPLLLCGATQTALTVLSATLLLQCGRPAQNETGPQEVYSEPPVVDLRRPAPVMLGFDPNVVPVRPSTAEERQNYWWAQEAKDEVLCEKAGPRLRGKCIAQVAKLKSDSSLCERIDETHRWERSSCYRYVAKEQQDAELCRKVADLPIRSLCEEAERVRPGDLRWYCQDKPGESMRAACETDAQDTARLEQLEEEYWVLVREYSLPFCEAMLGGYWAGDYFVRFEDECYRWAQKMGINMACLHESGPGMCLAWRSVKTKTILCDAIPSEYARMLCFKHLSQYGPDLYTYERAELFRATETVVFGDRSELVEYLASGNVTRQNLEDRLQKALAEPGVCDGTRLEKPRRISGGRELGQKIGFIGRCEWLGEAWEIELISFR